MELSPEMTATLTTAAHQLSGELGFTVSPENVIAHLLKKFGVPVVTDLVDGAAEQLMRAGQKIEAIKLIRNEKGLGLKDAKTYCEERWEHLRPVRV